MIVRFHAENFQRLRAVEIEPGTSVVQIRGRNSQGKTSILDAIESVLGGKDHVPDQPVRMGAEFARVVVETEELIATRVFDADGETKLKVTTKAGAPVKTGQTVLDRLVSPLSFDPVAFTRQKPSAQRETLRALVGLDFTALDKERATVFEQRTDVHREAKRLEGELSGIKFHEDAPDAETSGAELLAELDRIAAAARAAEGLEAQHGALVAGAATRRGLAKTKREQAAELLAEAERIEASCVEQDALAAETIAKAQLARAAVPDDAPVRDRIAGADAANAKVRENARRREVSGRLSRQHAKSETLTARIAQIDNDKACQLADAKFPLPGMSISDTGIVMNGLPFEQASGAEQLRAAVAIASALNPGLRVLLVRDGSLLDADSMRALSDAAEASGTQVWLEVVSSDPEGAGVYIEDGRVATASNQAAE